MLNKTLGTCPLHTRWESHEINAYRSHISTALFLTRFNSIFPRSLATNYTHVGMCQKRNRLWYKCDHPCYGITPLLWASRPYYECHAQLWFCSIWILKVTHMRCLSSYGFPIDKHLSWFKIVIAVLQLTTNRVYGYVHQLVTRLGKFMTT